MSSHSDNCREGEYTHQTKPTDQSVRNKFIMLDHECQQRLAKDFKTCNDEKCSDSQITYSKYQDYSQAPTKQKQQCIILKKVPRHTRSSKFPFTLHQMLELVDKYPEEYYIEGIGSFRPRDVLHWEHHGRAFVIVDKNKVAKYFLPKFFPLQTEYSSFQRQLNLYGFTRLIGQGTGTTSHNMQSPGKYYHEMFLRTRPDLCRWIVRSKKPADEIRQLIDPASQPDFESFPPLEASSGRDVDALQLSKNSCGPSDGSIKPLISKSMAKTERRAERNLTPKQNAATILVKRSKEGNSVAQKNQSQYQESRKRFNEDNIDMRGNNDSKKSWVSSVNQKANRLISTPSVCLSEPRLDQNLDRKINYVNEEDDVNLLWKGRQMKRQKQRIFEPNNQFVIPQNQTSLQDVLEKTIATTLFLDTRPSYENLFCDCTEPPPCSHIISVIHMEKINFVEGQKSNDENIESLEPNDIFHSTSNFAGLEEFRRLANHTRPTSSDFASTTPTQRQRLEEFVLSPSTMPSPEEYYAKPNNILSFTNQIFHEEEQSTIGCESESARRISIYSDRDKDESGWYSFLEDVDL